MELILALAAINALINYYVIKSMASAGLGLGLVGAFAFIGKDIIGLALGPELMISILGGLWGFVTGYEEYNKNKSK